MKKLNLIHLIGLLLVATLMWTKTAYSQSEKIILYPMPQEFLTADGYPSSFQSYPQSSVLVRDVLSSLSPGDKAVLIVGGERIDVITTGMKRRIDGFTWSGKPNGVCSWDTLVITVSGDAAFGSIYRGDKRFKIRPGVANGIVYVEEENPGLEMPIGDDEIVSPPPPPSQNNLAPLTYEALSASSTTTVDIMVYYTPGVESYLGGSSSVQAGIQHLIDLANEAYTNSNIDLQLRLVHIEKVSYPDDGSLNTPIDDLTNAQAPFSNMPSLRSQYGADLVTLMRRFNKNTNNACGLAWLINSLSNLSWNAEYTAFSVVQVGTSSDGSGYYCRDLTLAHELGHNFGCAHDRAHASSSGIFSYSYGYDRTGIFATIMSYASAPNIPYFSNPSVTYQGYAIGVPEGSPDAADNARTIRETKTHIAAYRSQAQPTCTLDDRIQKIYIAYYQRPGDPGGMSYWTSQLNQSGGNLYVVINPFATSQEAQTLYGQINSTTIGNVIDAIYQALFNRLPDAAGKQYYVSGFRNGQFTAGTIALNVLNGASGTDLTTINNKLYVANQFTCEVQRQNVNYSGASDADKARQFLRTVTSDSSSVNTALSNLQALLDQIKP
ncbi:MAG: M12 family metallo-peptidase [Thermoproteota archaeon]